jgi:hypothetical protein
LRLGHLGNLLADGEVMTRCDLVVILFTKVQLPAGATCRRLELFNRRGATN